MIAASWDSFFSGVPISGELEDESAWWPSAGVMSMDPIEEPGMGGVSPRKDPEGMDTGALWDNEYGTCARMMALELDFIRLYKYFYRSDGHAVQASGRSGTA
jgi:hypothetical protein